MWSQTDCILGTDLRMFQNADARDPRHNTGHYLVLGCLCGATYRDHQQYLGKHTHILLHPPWSPSQDDAIFALLWKAVTRILTRKRVRNSWILEETLRVMDGRVSIWRDLDRDQCRIRDLGCRVM